MRLIAVGKLKKKRPESALIERYLLRISSPNLRIHEVSQGTGDIEERKRREAKSLLEACSPNPFIILLDEKGKSLSSLEFASKYQQWKEDGRQINFMIGGADGFHHTLIDSAHFMISLGRMTWPHMMVRILLVEQIYRAQTIERGHPYHRADHPF